jgi:putative transposase
MPEHFHLLMGEPAKGDPSVVMQVLKQTVSRRILEEARRSGRGSRLLSLLRRSEASGRPGEVRFWQSRFYDFNVWSEKKRLEKLDYMHHNPLTRGLVKHPKDWPWSSYRFYAFGDARMLRMDSW